MKRSAVIYVEKATPAALTEFKDALSNMLVSIQESWSVDIKTYRCLAKNLSSEVTKLMYSVTLSHHNKKTVLITGKNAVTTTSNSADIPSVLLYNSCSTGTTEPFDNILDRLSNIWSQRQSIRGEAGETFVTTHLTVRAINLFAYSGFKGLLLELESLDGATEAEFQGLVDRILDLLKSIKARDGKVSQQCLEPSRRDYLSDLAYQYAVALDI